MMHARMDTPSADSSANKETASPGPASGAAPSLTDGAKKINLYLLFLIVVIDLLGFGIVLPLLPLYAKKLHASPLDIGLLMASFSAMQFLFAPVWGRLSDRIGRRPVLLAGLGGSVVFYSMFGVASIYESLPLLFVARIGAGICGATISTTQASVADSTGLEGRARGMALIGAAFGIGFTFGPVLGGLVTRYEKVILGKEYALNTMPGFVAAALSLIAWLICLIKLEESHKPGAASAGTGHRQLINIKALREAIANPALGPLLLIFFLAIFAFAQFETTLSLLGNDSFNLDQEHVLYLFCYIGFSLSLIQGGLVRFLAPKLGEAPMTIMGAAFMTIGLFLISLSAAYASLTMLYCVIPVAVCGFAFLTPSIQSLISRRTDPERQGEMLGLAQSASSLSRILGPCVSNALYPFGAALTYKVASGLAALSFLMAVMSVRKGRDFGK